MTDVLNTCPTCGMQYGHCKHTTEGQVTRSPGCVCPEQASGRLLISEDCALHGTVGISTCSEPACTAVAPPVGGAPGQVPLEILNSLLGLVQMISHRDDLPAGLKQIITTHWRYTEAMECSERFERDPTRPESAGATVPAAPHAACAAAQGGAVRKRNNQLYDPKCRELAEYFAAGDDRVLTEAQLDELSQDIQDAVEGYLCMLDSEGQS